jgi:hypothetical protein
LFHSENFWGQGRDARKNAFRGAATTVEFVAVVSDFYSFSIAADDHQQIVGNDVADETPDRKREPEREPNHHRVDARCSVLFAGRASPLLFPP